MDFHDTFRLLNRNLYDIFGSPKLFGYFLGLCKLFVLMSLFIKVLSALTGIWRTVFGHVKMFLANRDVFHTKYPSSVNMRNRGGTGWKLTALISLQLPTIISILISDGLAFSPASVYTEKLIWENIFDLWNISSSWEEVKIPAGGSAIKPMRYKNT